MKILSNSDITTQVGWVIVTEKMVYHFNTFEEALHVSKVINGHLMTKKYYDYSMNKKIGTPFV